MSERNNVLILLAVIVAIGFFAQAMQIFQGTDTTTIAVSLNNTGNLDTPVQSITITNASRIDAVTMFSDHLSSGYTVPSGYFPDRIIHINSSIDGALSNHHIKIDISSMVGMQADFDDITITEMNGTNMPYFMLSKTDGVVTRIVTTKSVPASGGADIKLVYGDSTATSTSDYNAIYGSISPYVITDSPGDIITGTTSWASLATYPYDDLIIPNASAGYARSGSATTYGRVKFIYLDGTTYTTPQQSGAPLGTAEFVNINPEQPVTSVTFEGKQSGGALYLRYRLVYTKSLFTTNEPTYSIGQEAMAEIEISPSSGLLDSSDISTATYGSYPIIPAKTAQDFSLNGTQNFNYSIDFTPTDLTVTTSSSVLYADRTHTFNAVVKDHNTGIAMPTQPDKVKYRLVGSGNTSVSAKEFVGTSITLPALQKGTYTLFTSVGWNNIPSWSNEISQSVILTDAATPAQAVALSVVEALTETTTDTTSNETTEDILVGAPGRIVDGWKTMFDTIVTVIKNIIHNVSAVFS